MNIALGTSAAPLFLLSNLGRDPFGLFEDDKDKKQESDNKAASLPVLEEAFQPLASGGMLAMGFLVMTQNSRMSGSIYFDSKFVSQEGAKLFVGNLNDAIMALSKNQL